MADPRDREYAELIVDGCLGVQPGYRPANKRMMNHDIPWVACQYPTAALAQEAGLSSDDFAELLYGSV